MGRMFFIGMLLFVLTGTGSGSGLYAQAHSDPFRSIEVAFSVQSNINENRFHEQWRSSPGINGGVGFPFYFGTVELNMGYGFFEGKTVGIPDIDRLQISLRWINKTNLFSRLKVGGGPSLLGSVFFFKNVSEEQQTRVRNLYGGTSPETEIGVGLQADLTYKLSSSWSVRAHVSRSVIFTSTKMKLTYVGVGMVKRMNLPGWLSEVLR